MKAAAADMRALLISELFQILMNEWEAATIKRCRLMWGQMKCIANVDPLTNGPMLHTKKNDLLHLMDKGETYAVLKHVVQDMAPKLFQEAFCEPIRKKPLLRYTANMCAGSKPFLRTETVS